MGEDFDWDELEESEAAREAESAASTQQLDDPLQECEAAREEEAAAGTDQSRSIDGNLPRQEVKSADDQTVSPQPEEAASVSAAAPGSSKEKKVRASSSTNGTPVRNNGSAIQEDIKSSAPRLSDANQSEVNQEPTPASSSRVNKPPGVKCWRVVHSRVVQRAGPSVTANIVQVSTRGDVVEGIAEDIGGTKWLRMQVATASGLARTMWMLVDGSQLGFGNLLQEVEYDEPVQSSLMSIRGEWMDADIVMRDVEGRGAGLFTERTLEPGETVLQDKPFFTRPMPRHIQDRKEFTEKWAQEFNSIRERLIVPGEGEIGNLSASGAMVRNAIGFVKSSQNLRSLILDLYVPDLGSDHPLIKVTRKVAELCIRYLPECKSYSASDLLRGMLAIEMNIFAGGRCFQKLSRVNHSCVPNIVYIGSSGNWKFQAYDHIGPGEELLHSYLAEELLLPSEIRQRLLWRSKCFQCVCERCRAGTDPLRKIPCRWCCPPAWRVVHKDGMPLRQGPSRFAKQVRVVEKGTVCIALGWVQDDWILVAISPELMRLETSGWMLVDGKNLEPAVHEAFCEPCALPESYKTSKTASIWHRNTPHHWLMAGLPESKDDMDEIEMISPTIPPDLWLPPSLIFWNFEGPYALYENGEWRCEKCGRSPPDQKELLEKERLLSRYAETLFFNPQMTEGMGPAGPGGQSLKLVKHGFVAKAMDLLATVFGVLGTQHWASHWGRILVVDLLLAKWENGGFARPEGLKVVKPLLVRHLDTLWSWLESLGLAQDPSCFLWDRVKIALALYDSEFRERPSFRPYQMNRKEVAEHAEDAGTRETVVRLRNRFETCKKQVDLLPLRPLIIEGSLSFAG